MHEDRITALENKSASAATPWYTTTSASNQNVTVPNINNYTLIGVCLRLSGQVVSVPINLFKTGRSFDCRDYASGPIYGFSFKYINDTTVNIGAPNGNSCDCPFIWMI